MPGNLSPLAANYGNGWTCNDVASEVIKEVKNNPILCEISWSSQWQSSMQEHIARYKACSADAAKCFLTVRDVDLAVNHILDDEGNVSDSKCLAIRKNMFPLKVEVVIGQDLMRTMILEKLHVTYMRSSRGTHDWADPGISGNHAKFFMVDDTCFYIGSQNLYIANLAEWGIIVDDAAQAQKVISEYWEPMWECSYNPLGTHRDCDVEEVLRGLDINRSGKDPNDCTPEELAVAEAARLASNCGSTGGSTLLVLCRRATNLKNADWFSKSDPYVALHLEDSNGVMVSRLERTHTIQDDLNPHWDQLIIFEGLSEPLEYTLRISVFDEDNFLGIDCLVSDDLLGEATVQLSLLKNNSDFQEKELDIEKAHSSKLFLGLNTLGEWGI